MEESLRRQHRHWLVFVISAAWLSLTTQAQVATIAELVAVTIPAGTSGQQVNVAGRNSANDGGGGSFVYDSASAASTNLGTIFKPAASNGRWLRQYSGSLNANWFGAFGDGVTDSTSALTNAYQVAAVSPGKSLFIPSGNYQFSAQLLWNEEVDISGQNLETTFLRKVGDFTGVKIDSTGAQQIYSNFHVTSADNAARNSGDTGDGIEINYGAHIQLNKVTVKLQGGNGISLKAGNIGSYYDVEALANGGDGIKINGTTGYLGLSANACVWNRVNANDNVGVGFNVENGDSHVFTSLVSENNDSVGLRVNTFGNLFTGIYLEENNGGGAVPNAVLTSTSLDNYVMSLNNVEMTDSGLHNSIIQLRGPWSLKTGGTDRDLTIDPSGSGNVLLSDASGNVKLGIGFLAGDVPDQRLHVRDTTNSVKAMVEGVSTNVNFPNFDGGAGLLLKNLSNTNNNYTWISAVDSAGSHVANVSFVNLDHSSHSGLIALATASTGTPITRLQVANHGLIAFTNLVFTNLGSGIQIKEGSNARMGTAALVNGTVTVSNTSVTASTRIFLTRAAEAGTTVGILGVGTVVANTSFVIESVDLAGALSADDDSTVNWLLIEPSS